MIPNIGRFSGAAARETAKGMAARPQEAGAPSQTSDVGDSVPTLFRLQLLKLHRASQRQANSIRRDLRELYNLSQIEEAALPATLGGFADIAREMVAPLLDATVREASLRELALDFEFSIWALTLPDLKLVPEDAQENIFLPDGTVKVSTPGVLSITGGFLGELADEPPREYRLENEPTVPGINFFVPGLKNQMLEYFSKRFSTMLGIKPIKPGTADSGSSTDADQRLIFVALFADALRDRRKQIEEQGVAQLETAKSADKNVIKVEVNSVIYGSFSLVKGNLNKPPANN